MVYIFFVIVAVGFLIIGGFIITALLKAVKTALNIEGSLGAFALNIMFIIVIIALIIFYEAR